MALITGSASASIDPVTAQFAPQISGLKAGEDLKNVAFCFIASDGDIEESIVTTGSATIGVVSRQVKDGEPATLFGAGTIVGQYSAGMTPGTVLFLSDSDPGSLEDAATVADIVGVAIVLTATDILVTRTNGLQEGEGM